MKLTTGIAALSLLSALSFGAFAADSVNAEQAQSMQAIGTISVSGVSAAPMDINAQLKEKADAQGAKAYRIVEAYNNGNYHATAAIYK